jgi:polysaccharide export outer membrane protein
VGGNQLTVRDRVRRTLLTCAAGLVGLGAVGCTQQRTHPADLEGLTADNCCPPPDYMTCGPVRRGTLVGKDFQPIPPTEVPPPPENALGHYRIGVGDVLNVAVPGQDRFFGLGETSKGDLVGVRVKEDGKVYLPMIHGVVAAGRTVLELQEDVQKRLTEYVKDIFVSVDVLEFRSQRFYVLGEVAKPGVQPVNGEVRLLDAISAAGGLKNGDADLESSYVLRQGSVLPVSLPDVLTTGSLADNIIMRHGDVVFVPDAKDKKVYVLGEVKRPGIVPILKRRLTLVEALAASGGLDPATAKMDEIRIFRGGWRQPRAFTLSSDEVNKYGNDILLKPGDRIFVAPSGLATWGRALGQFGPVLNTAVSGAALVELFKD